jgi:hypothetical protein
MAVNLSMFAGVGAQFFDNNGVPLAGGLIYTYAAGTTTPAVTYTSNSGLTAHANPIVLDAAGRVPGGEIWLTLGTSYKFLVKTSANVQIASYDNVSGNGFISLIANFTGTGSQTSFSLPTAASAENNTQIYINGVYQNKSTYSVVGSALVFSEAPPVTSAIEVMYI